jgi:hypothetical protein
MGCRTKERSDRVADLPCGANHAIGPHTGRARHRCVTIHMLGSPVLRTGHPLSRGESTSRVHSEFTLHKLFTVYMYTVNLEP